jgi:hypothetical protein
LFLLDRLLEVLDGRRIGRLHKSGRRRVCAGFPRTLSPARDPHDKDHYDRYTKDHELLGFLRKQTSGLR